MQVAEDKWTQRIKKRESTISLSAHYIAAMFAFRLLSGGVMTRGRSRRLQSYYERYPVRD
jgi:hypothetical protein